MLKFRLTRDDLTRDIKDIRRLAGGSGRRLVQRQMANRFLEISKGTIGLSGQNRPKPWPALSPNYARRVKRSIPTLKLTGALLASMKTGRETDRFCEVEANTPYTWAHMFGNPANKLPARPYFPVEFSGQSYRPTYYCDREIFLMAARWIQRVTHGALTFNKARWTRATYETHPIASPVTSKD